MVRSDRAPRQFVLLALLVVGALLATPLAEGAVAGPRTGGRNVRKTSGWEMVFRDEFSGSALNRRNWETQFPWGRDRSNVGELQWYADDAFTVGGGQLKIKAKEAPEEHTHRYTSGLISSYNSFDQKYGRYEIRAKVPSGKGLWPAFWLLPPDTSWPPEIDVFEIIGSDPDTVHMTVHWDDGGILRKSGREYSGANFSKGFHTFAVEWGPEELVWFVDGVERHRAPNTNLNGPLYVLANLAVGGDWPGAPDAQTAFPASFDIDYIRVYKAASSPQVMESDGKREGKRGRRNDDDRRDDKRRRLGKYR